MKSTDELKIERQGATLKLTLARPSRANALSESLVETLLAVLDEAGQEDVRLVVFAGEGKHFCSGFDLGDLESARDADLVYRLLRIETLLQHVAHAPFVTLALAHGRVVGAGADLFCACSERVAAPAAAFRMPGWRFGIALGTRRLAARVGADRARSILLESRMFSAEEALAIGFATVVAPETGWPAIQEESARRAQVLDRISSECLLRFTISDTRAADMAALVETASRPGLKKRIMQYRESQKAPSSRS
ncbi:MAG TPA: enoyl-CoA hydratase/isomerase family protein [Xanthobacteraceae bacterium]|nr:enoyl-CoA hydratase/isomerase family protein [Xanthobacteraceae bacterium]